MEMDIAKKVLGDIGIIRKLVEVINDEDPGELNKACSTFIPREQYISGLGGKMRLERGNAYISVYCDKDADVHIVAYADERLHMYHTEIFSAAIDYDQGRGAGNHQRVRGSAGRCEGSGGAFRLEQGGPGLGGEQRYYLRDRQRDAV